MRMALMGSLRHVVHAIARGCAKLKRRSLDLKQETKPLMKHAIREDQSLDRAHTFIARFWLEPREIANAEPIWRGVVEHISSGHRKYITELGEISAFIAEHLHKTNR